jgi:glycerol-3-phosphate dehydrogenase (NAD(P)+)
MLAREKHEVVLWARRPELADEIRRTRRNAAYRPEIELPAEVDVTADLAQAVSGSERVVVATPSHAVRDVLTSATPYLKPTALVVLVAKGMERSTGMRVSQVAAEALGRSPDEGVAVLSGPNLSEEIARGLPAAAVVASRDPATMQEWQRIFASPLFRVYTNCDIIGVELCGAFKNVIALAAGISDGMGHGANAKAALISRGLVEMASLVVAGGGQAVTCWGLAGIGDVIVTCHSPLSRNWTVGYLIGRGYSVQEAQGRVGGIAEGVQTCAAVVEAARGQMELPIAEAVYAVIYRGEVPVVVGRRLMTRRWRDEAEAWGDFGIKPSR